MLTDTKIEQDINIQARKYLLENDVPQEEMFKAHKDFESGAIRAIENYKKMMEDKWNGRGEL